MASAQDLAATGVVVGMKQLAGDVRPRVDIDVLLTSQPDTFNLFLQALGALQQDPKLLGYYALAGMFYSIHDFLYAPNSRQASTDCRATPGMMSTKSSRTGSAATALTASSSFPLGIARICRWSRCAWFTSLAEYSNE